MTDILYQISPVDPNAHLFRVTVTVNSPDAEGQTLYLPNWIPGSYMIRDFSRHIVSMSATCGDQPVALTKMDKSTWQAEAVEGALCIVYDVYAWDLSVREAHLDATHGFFNGTSVFLCVAGQEASPCRLQIAPPETVYGDPWRVATAMSSVDVDTDGFGWYQCEDYDELIDHPVEMGAFERYIFDACGVEHELVLSGQFRTDGERICRDLKRICEHQIRFFGEPAPVDRYLFLVQIVGDGYGGLEHRASTSLIASRNSLPRPGETGYSDEYIEFLGLCSHEYFHTWNIKRIKPAVFMPYALQQESYTTLLWAFEGITSYYDDLTLVRTGLITPEQYLGLVGRTISRVWKGKGRLKQSIADSSFDAWNKFYKQGENAPNAIVSYYAKGALIALNLDLLLRRETQGKVTLDHVMRAAWQEYGLAGVGLDEHAMERLVASVSGLDLTDFFDSAVRGTDDLALSSILKHAGVELEWRASQSSQDRGGKPIVNPLRPLSLGVRIQPGTSQVTHVFEGEAGHFAGLAAGDQLVALDGLKLDEATATSLLSRYSAGDTVHLHFFRRDELMQSDLILQPAPMDTCALTIFDEAALQVWLEADQ